MNQLYVTIGLSLIALVALLGCNDTSLHSGGHGPNPWPEASGRAESSAAEARYDVFSLPATFVSEIASGEPWPADRRSLVPMETLIEK